MICPACNYELSFDSACCENCGAPTYLATAIQAAEITHCTYCGAREEAGRDMCLTCGLKKNFKTSEVVIGTCRNCGAAWRHIWLYCETCGVARENGLVDSLIPKFASFSQTPMNSPASRPAASAYKSNALTPTEEQEWLSENEVVERMFVNSNGSELTAKRNSDLFNFFRTEAPSNEIQSLPDKVPATPPAISNANAPSPVVVYDLPVISEAVTATVDSNPKLPSHGVSSASAAVSIAEPPAVNQTIPPTPTKEAAARKTTDSMNVTAATVAAINDEKNASAPVQAVRFIHRPRAGVTPTADKSLIKIVAVLIGLILIFSSLIVSGFRIRDLFRGAHSQSPATVEAGLAFVMPVEKAPPAPEGMVYLPGGSFRMGVEEGDSFEVPAHDVTVSPFFMDRTEVTNEQYAVFAKTTNHLAPPDWKSGNYPEGTAKFPVVHVSWQDANDYAAWAGKRLPTEPEWEFAARSNDGRRYPWGVNWDASNANTSESNINHPVVVGSYANAANPFGLVDMAGNVWEWTAGEVVSYKDPTITLAPGKVIRGGAFYAPKERATTTFRGFAPPDKQAAGIGFRCIKEVN